MNIKNNWFAILIFSFFILLSSISYAQMNEKAQLRDSFFGDFTKAKIQKKMGKCKLQVWAPYVQYSNTLPSAMKAVSLSGVGELQVEYDEIWRANYDSLFTAVEKKKWKGQFDKNTIYWKNDKIQAYTLEKFYISDPSTGKKLPAPSHKVVNIYDRKSILDKLSGK
ncbi:MAG: hypothetical protein M0Q01_14040 [Syntrophales bacterium]|jgi:hypothetical protein|nr:hypothetical protein [Syntrophales bacterium]